MTGEPAVSIAEQVVGDILAGGVRPEDRLWRNQRITDDRKNAELDFVLALPGAGVIAVEVKGGEVAHDGTRWTQTSQGGHRRVIDPVTQVRTAMYLLRHYVEHDPRWARRGRVRHGHAVVFPFTDIADDFSLPDCPRHMIFGRGDLDHLVDRLARIAVRQTGSDRVPTGDDVAALEEILRGRNLPQADVLALSLEREALADRLTQQQHILLEVSKLMHRLEVRGGAGSGKTLLAMEQARRLSTAGQRVALVCYFRGLAAYFQRVIAGWDRRHRPAYVGTFHGLGIEKWGAQPSVFGDDDSAYWEEALPAAMVEIAAGLPPGQRFDAVVVDEAQDFADRWWAACWHRWRTPPAAVSTSTATRGNGCSPVSAACRSVTPCSCWSTTFATPGRSPRPSSRWRSPGARHPEQVARQQLGQDEYWSSFFDSEQVFYGHVLGFKGLERRVIVLAVNDNAPRDRGKERLYVGLSRARDVLVVCGDLGYLREVGGEPLLRKLRPEPAPQPGV